MSTKESDLQQFKSSAYSIKPKATKLMFQPYKDDEEEENLAAQKILTLVAHGQQNKAETLIRVNPNLLFVRSSITDWSGRVFESISPWEYCLWALDTRYMATMMLNCIPKNDEGKAIAHELLAQYRALLESGVTYKVDGENITESNFDLGQLIGELNTFVNKSRNWYAPRFIYQWRNKIGGEQRKLPVHIRQHYCDPNHSFHPPIFKYEEFTRSLKYHDLRTGNHLYWRTDSPSGDSTLGIRYAIFRAWREKAMATTLMTSGANVDLIALNALYSTRLEDLHDLEAKLCNLLEYSDVVEPSVRLS